MTAPLFFAMLVFAMLGNEVMTRSLAGRLGAELGDVELQAFPDGEKYLRLVTDIAGRSIAIICLLDRPNDKIQPLIFAAATARELGAAQNGLVAHYLAHTRQDRRFTSGEAVTSRQTAKLLSNAFDWRSRWNEPTPRNLVSHDIPM